MMIKLTDYIELVQWTAESIVHPNKASLPKQINHTLDHLNIQSNQWIVQVKNYGKQ